MPFNCCFTTGGHMRTLVFALSVFLLFSSSPQAVTFHSKKWEIQSRKWVTAPMVTGKPFFVKAFQTADEMCANVREIVARIQCRKNFNALPQISWPLQNDEVETFSDKGVLIRINKKTFCDVLAAEKIDWVVLFLPCEIIWEEYVRQQKR